MLSRLRGMYAFSTRDEYVPEPFTLYKGIRGLPPGTYRWVDILGRKKQETFCSISEEYENPSENTMRINPDRPCTHLRELLLDSVGHHLVADVPVGMFLSSRIDSTSLATLVSEVAPTSLNTITLGFQEYQGTKNYETPLAQQVAKMYSGTH